MKIDIKLFLFFLFNITFVHAHDAIDIQNITTSHLLPIHKIECTTDELFNNKKSERTNLLLSPNENQSWSNQLPAAQLLKDFHLPKTPTINRESFPSANHTLYDFSKMEPTRAPQNIGLNFTALRHTECPLPVGDPPDIILGVGPTQIIAVVNQGVVSFDKATGLRDHIIESTLAGFANFFNYSRDFLFPPETTDPHIRYDQFTDRWFFVCISYNTIVIEDIAVFGPNNLLIAVSDSGIITKTTKWTAYNFPVAAIFPPGDFGIFADFPTPGLDANALYIGINMFLGGTVYTSAAMFVFPKSGFINGNPVGTAFRNFVGLNAPHGVDNFDPAPPFGFFISTAISPQAALFLITISNPGTAPLLTSIVPIVVDPYNTPVPAPHKGNALAAQGLGFIWAFDERLWMAHIRNNQLFTTHHIGVDSTGSSLLIPDRTALRWYQIDVANPLLPSVIQQGTFFDSSLVNPRFFLFPAIMTNARGDLSLSCSTSAADQFIDALTMGRFAFDPPGTLQAPVFLTNSTSSYNDMSPTDASPQRWGDYSYTALDPSDQMTMWTAQDFCAQTDNWGMQIAQLLAP